jgi:ketosteroid isomerase-like protein
LSLCAVHSKPANRRDLDAVISFYASDAVFEARGAGGPFEGRVAFRSFLVEWFGAYEELELKLEDVRDLGSGVVFAVVVQEGVPAGRAGHRRLWQREEWVFLWERGLIARHSTYDVDEGRALAERLAEEWR